MAANPYVQGWREWDERYADLVLGKRNWQIAAAGMMAITLVLAFGMVWLSTRSKFVPYVVEVDKFGYALAAPSALANLGNQFVVYKRRKRDETAWREVKFPVGRGQMEIFHHLRGWSVLAGRTGPVERDIH